MIVHGYYYNTSPDGVACDIPNDMFFIPKWFKSITNGYTTVTLAKESLNKLPQKYFPDDCILHITSDVMPEYEEYFITEYQLWDYLLMIEKYVRLYKKDVTVYALITHPEKKWDVHYTIHIPTTAGLKISEKTTRTQKRVDMER